MSFFREQLELWLGEIEVKGDRVLDVGGGALSVKNRVRSWDVKDYKILDNCLEKPIEKIDYNIDLNENWEIKIYEKFDIVFCLEIAEYLYRPADTFYILGNHIKQGGILYASFPMIYPIHTPHREDCLRYTRFGIIKILEKAGFKIVEITGRVAKAPDKLIEFYQSDGMHIKADSTITGYLVKARKI